MGYEPNGRFAPPLGEMNTTPLIDVLLVLLVMLILTIPVATNSLEFNLPIPTDRPRDDTIVDPVKNKIVLTSEGAILWNGVETTSDGLARNLRISLNYEREPELQFEPEALAGYNLSAQVLAIVKRSGATNFGFVGNERFREFGKLD